MSSDVEIKNLVLEAKNLEREYKDLNHYLDTLQLHNVYEGEQVWEEITRQEEERERKGEPRLMVVKKHYDKFAEKIHELQTRKLELIFEIDRRKLAREDLNRYIKGYNKFKSCLSSKYGIPDVLLSKGKC